MDQFAATHPIEANKVLFAAVVYEGASKKRMGMQTRRCRRSKAHFHAEARNVVYVDLPKEDAEEGKCGRLKQAMYGTRDAAQSWEYAYTNFMTSVGRKGGINATRILPPREEDKSGGARGMMLRYLERLGN